VIEEKKDCVPGTVSHKSIWEDFYDFIGADHGVYVAPFLIGKEQIRNPNFVHAIWGNRDEIDSFRILQAAVNPALSEVDLNPVFLQQAAQLTSKPQNQMHYVPY
jgi:hypothetical protein